MRAPAVPARGSGYNKERELEDLAFRGFRGFGGCYMVCVPRSVRNGLGARAAPRGNCQEDWTGPDHNFYSVPSWDILGLQG